MKAERPEVLETKQHRLLRDAIWEALPKWSRYIVAIDGRDCAGKSTLARYLAWQLGMPAIELDNFRDPKLGPYDFRYPDLKCALEARLGRDRPTIVEGVTVLRALEQISLEPDYLVFVAHDNPDLDQPGAELQLYLERYKPRERADSEFSW